MRRILYVVLVVVLLFAMAPFLVTDASAATGKMTLQDLQKKFPDGKYWNGGNPDSYTSKPCTHHDNCTYDGSCGCNTFLKLSSQCMGYAEKLGYDFTGYNPRNNANGWKTYTNSSALDSLKPGDIVRYIAGAYNHSIFVTAVNGDTVTFTDCNGDGKTCIIRWNKTISKSTLKQKFYHLRSAPYEISSVNTLSMQFHANGGTIPDSYKTTTSGTVLRLRASANLSAQTLTQIPDGTEITAIETTTADGYTWVKIQYNGYTGWCAVSDGLASRAGYSVNSNMIYSYEQNGNFIQKWSYGSGGVNGLTNVTTFKLTRTGYIFLGWSLSPDGSTGIFDQDDLSLKAEDIDPSVKNGSKTVVLYAVWHAHTEITIPAVAPTCTQTGLTAGTKCSTCGQIFEAQAVVAAKGHNYQSSVTAPTCTQNGYTTNTCIHCGDSYKNNEKAALGHNYKAVTTEPTCTKAGYTTYTCTRCSNNYVDNMVSASGHRYTSVVTPPQIGVQGYTTHTCVNCGNSYVDSYVDALPEEVVRPSGNAELKFAGATLALQSDLTMSIGIHKDVIASGNYENLRVEVSMYDVKFDTLNVAYYDSTNFSKSGNYIMCKFTGISPRKMNDAITLKMYATYQGVEYSSEMTTTVGAYCFNSFKNSSSNLKLMTVIADLLNFGAAHQTYTGYNTANLVNAEMTEEQKAYASNYDLNLKNNLNVNYSVLEGATASFYGATVVLTEKIEVQYWMSIADLEGVTLQIKCDNATFNLDSKDFIKSGSYYYINFTGLAAKQLRSVMYVTICRNGVAISNTITYSVESYAFANIGSSNKKLVALLTNMIYYGDSANNYFKK